MNLQELIDFHTVGAEACEAYAVTPGAAEDKNKDIGKHYNKRAKWHRDAIALVQGLQGQGEPVAWLIQWGSVIPGCRGHREVVLRNPGALDAVITPLYAEQPAPVAVVMPERIQGYPAQSNHRSYNDGWNACLTKVARLNKAGRSIAAELVEMMSAPNYFENMDGVDHSKWFKWDWSEHKSRPVNKNYLCDVVLADGRVLFGQSPHDFDWSGDDVKAARQAGRG